MIHYEVTLECSATTAAALERRMRDTHIPDMPAPIAAIQNEGAKVVLAWSTEGATDPGGWDRVVGRPVPT